MATEHAELTPDCAAAAWQKARRIDARNPILPELPNASP
jgi:hypothetical protein